MTEIKTRCLSEISEVITKGTTPTTMGYSFEKSGIAFLKIESFDEFGKLIPDKVAFVSEECHEKFKRSQLKKDDVLFSIAGAIGKVSIVTEDMLPANTNQALAIIRINNKSVYIPFVRLILTSNIVKKQIEKQKQGVAQINLSLKNIGDLEIPLPSYDEQVQYVDIFDKIIRITKNRKKQVELLDILIKSRFIEMFVDKYEKIKVSTKLRTTSGGTPKSDESEYYSNGTIPWLTSSEVNQGRIEKTEKYITEKGLSNSSAKWIPKKSIVIAMYGATAGKVGIIEIPTTTNQAVCAVLPHDEYNPEYLRFAFEYISDELAGKAVGGGQPNISQAIIKDSFIYNPPLVVQRKFSVYVEQVDKLKFVVQKSLDETQKLFDSLMQEYFG